MDLVSSNPHAEGISQCLWYSCILASLGKFFPRKVLSLKSQFRTPHASHINRVLHKAQSNVIKIRKTF